MSASKASPEGGPATVSKDPRVYLAYIMECIQKIERFSRGGKEGIRAILLGLKAGCLRS